MNKYLFIVFLFTILTSCYDDKIIIDESDLISKDHPRVDVSCDIVGVVYDEFGKELIGFSNNLLGETYNSDYSAYYHFYAVDANQNGSILQMNKDNKSYQFTIKPLANEVNYFKHTIFTEPKILQGTSDKEIIIDVTDKSSVKIKQNSYKQYGNSYTGDVIIEAFSPDLNKSEQILSLPADHLAIDNDTNDVWLDIFDAVYIEIKTPSGEKLEIKEKEAEVSLGNIDCTGCIIWKYSDEQFKWFEHSLINNNNDIKFNIEKSGFYCIAKPYVYNQVEGKIHNGNKSISNRPIDIYIDDRLVERVFTTNSGKWFTHLPINTEYNYRVKIATENEANEKFSIGEDDLILPPFDLDNVNITYINLNGEIRNCNNQSLDNGFIKLWQGDEVKCLFYKNANINFDLINWNDEKIAMQTFDENWENIGPKVNYTPNNKKIDFAKAYTCNQIQRDGYFSLSMDGEEKLFSITQAQLRDGRTSFQIYDLKNINTELNIVFSGQEAREYNDNEINIHFQNLVLGNKVFDMNCQNSTEGCGFESFVIEEFGEKKNSWIKGKFKANFWVKSYNPLTAEYKKIEGSFLISKNF